METIWKYPLNVGENEVLMPRYSQVSTAQMQRNELQLWALVDDSYPKDQKRKFFVHGTGHPIENGLGLKYISTVQISGGALVFHIFEKHD